ncbi:hypothetical protein Tco_0577234, partial [Tanacetum coccineum]
DSDKEDDSAQDCFVLPIWPSYSSTNTLTVTIDDKNQEKEAYEEVEALRKKFETLVIKEGAAKSVTPLKWVAAEIWVDECYFIDQ